MNNTLKTSKVAGRNVSILNGTNTGARLLGYICNYTVRQGEIPLIDVDLIWKELEIPEWSKPKEPREKDVFKNACRGLEKVDYEDRHPWGPCRIIVVTDKLTPDEYVLTEKVFAHDDIHEKNLLQHNKLVRLKYNEKLKERITVSKYEVKSSIQKDKITEFQTTVRQYFERLITHNTSDQIRVALRNTFLHVHGIQWGSTAAVYFIPLEAQDVVAKWREFLKAFTEHYGTNDRYPSQIRALPYVDSDEHRNYIQEDIAKQTEAKFQALLHKTKRQLKTQNPENFEEMLQGKIMEKNKIRKEVKYYEKLLGTKIDIYFNQLEKSKIIDRGKKTLDGRVQALVDQLNEMA